MSLVALGAEMMPATTGSDRMNDARDEMTSKPRLL